MKLKTSFFNWTVFRKDITRFAPLWAVYFIGGVLVMQNVTDRSGYYGSFWYTDAANAACQTISIFSVINLIYAGLAAQLLFGDLYNSRLCNALHAMPMRRENWFFTHLVSGLAFSLVPNTVGILLVMPRMGALWYAAFVWLLGMTLHYLFFFGLAVFSSFCTGNRFAMAAVYAILNFASMIAQWFSATIYEPLMYGVEMGSELFDRLCPVVQLVQYNDLFYVNLVSPPDAPEYVSVSMGEGWGYLAILAVIGVGLLALSLLLYRRRKLESAGDFIAVGPLGPVFAVVYTLCVGAVFAMFGDLVGDGYVVYLVLGVIVGWFTGQMLLQRTIKVFKGFTFLWLGLVLTALFASIFMIGADVFNIVGWTPRAGNVSSVTIANYKATNYGYDGGYYGNRISVKLEDKADIGRIITAHEDILDRREEKNDETYRLVITYKLKDGRTVRRTYAAPASGTNYDIICDYFYTPENVFGYTDWEDYKESVGAIEIDGQQVQKYNFDLLLETMKADCENGLITTSYIKDAYLWAGIETVKDSGIHAYRDIVILPGAQTLEVMKRPEYILGYSDWDVFLENVRNVTVGDLRLDQQQTWEFMTKLRDSCEMGYVSTQLQEWRTLCKLWYDVAGEGSESYQRGLYVSAGAQNIADWLAEQFPEEWAAGYFG